MLKFCVSTMNDHSVIVKNVHGDWMQQILRTVLYYNNFNTILI